LTEYPDTPPTVTRRVHFIPNRSSAELKRMIRFVTVPINATSICDRRGGPHTSTCHDSWCHVYCWSHV